LTEFFNDNPALSKRRPQKESKTWQIFSTLTTRAQDQSSAKRQAQFLMSISNV
jgi:hypothetical protein